MNLPAKGELIDQNFNLIVDAIFGFSFSGNFKLVISVKQCNIKWFCSYPIKKGK